MTDKLQFVIPGKPQYITIVRLAVGTAADTAGFDVEEIEDIKTAVSEACKNISCHGSEGFADEYKVECFLDEGKMLRYHKTWIRYVRNGGKVCLVSLSIH